MQNEIRLISRNESYKSLAFFVSFLLPSERRMTFSSGPIPKGNETLIHAFSTQEAGDKHQRRCSKIRIKPHACSCVNQTGIDFRKLMYISTMFRPGLSELKKFVWA